MWTDPIVAEVREAREAYAKRFGYDLHRIFADLRKSEKERAAAAPKASAARLAAKPTPKTSKRKRKAA